MSTSERLTWETCPSCGRSAAVGWRGGIPLEVDCPGGCAVGAEVFARRTPRTGDLPSSAARWTAAARAWT